MKALVPIILIGLCGRAAAAEEPTTAVLRPFLRAYCVKCHGDTAQKGDRRFDGLLAGELGLDSAETIQEILDQLNLAAMPPEDERQPTAAELKRVVHALTAHLTEAREAARANGGKVVLRRLNRDEYRNTIRDLFQLRMVDFDPTTTFPADESTDGFDNVGEGLVTSEHLLRNYLEAARRVADKVVRPGPRPEVIRLTSESSAVAGDNVVVAGTPLGKTERQRAGRLFIKFRQPLGLRELDKRGVPADGEYVIRIAARAVRRKSRYKDEDLRYDSTEPMRLSISIDSRELGPVAHRVVAEYEVPDDETIEIEHRMWLDRGFTVHVHWANGPNGSFKRILRKVLPKYTKDALYPIRNPPEMYVGSGPELHVESLGIEGPFFEAWPPPGFARFFPDPPKRPDADYLDASLTRLADAAYRRPLRDGELRPYLDLARRHLADNGDFWEAARFGIRAVLTSPSFLYLVETDPEETGTRRLDPHELATRLSYFLWSSMPDEALRAAADDGSLLRADVLRDHVVRMLRDPRSEAFVRNFTGQWLELRSLGEMPPDPEAHPAYYADDLEAAMRGETRRFFAHILAGNRSILEFVESDYTFLNAALARHYGLPGVDGDDFRRVQLAPASHRGGLLGHASILTATSNGVETQPVRRGVWILENLLGTPPNPPPPDVEPIEPDTRGAATIRDLMERHRRSPVCYECHRRIDPLGFAMEQFDHLGVRRERYGRKLPIDATGELPDGTAIDGPTGIRAYLLEHPDRFTRCLTEKLFVYALGRRLSFTDRDDIDHIVTTLPTKQYGMQELVQQVVASEAFQSK